MTSSLCLFLLLLCMLIWPSKQQPKAIVPDRVVIMTVLDPSSELIVRDTFTLIRSLRLFGGSLNLATFIAFIPINSGEALFDELDTLDKLANLHVQVQFITQTPAPRPRTLNKFSAWMQFDFSRFDYLFWLDADIFVFGDPIPSLQAVMYQNQGPVTVLCAAELYSYMRRYPHINNTEMVWNPQLANFHLVGEGEITSHGVCNTGVLFIANFFLQKFMAALPLVVQELDALNPFQADRFLDSLYFVRVIHKLGDSVQLMPYELNYMTNFEVELLDSTRTADAILVHHLFDTEIFCETIKEEPYCRCSYLNKNAVDAGKIVTKLKTLITNGQCKYMIGEKDDELVAQFPLQQPEVLHNYENFRFKAFITEQASCSLLWPLSNSVIRPYLVNSFDLYLSCAYPHGLEFTSNTVNISLSWIPYKVLYTFETSNVETLDVIPSKIVVYQILKSTISDKHMPTQHLIKASIKLESYTLQALKALTSVEMTVLISFQELNIVMETTIHTQVLFNKMLPRGLVAYENNFIASKTVSLQSQLLIPEFLNDRDLNDVGYVLCCDSSRGTSTVLNLIDHWDVNRIIIFLVNKPVLYSGTMSAFAEFMIGKCRSTGLVAGRKRNCFVKLVGAKSISSLFKSIPNNSLDFVYTDIYLGYNEYKAVLRQSFPLLKIGGVLMGSRYVTDFQLSMNILFAVDDFAAQLPVAHNVFATFGEVFYSQNIETFTEKAMLCLTTYINLATECSPAWYILKYTM